MPWDRNAPVNPKYRTREHREAVAKFRKLIDAGQGWCAEAVCLMPSRYIEPGAKFDAAHDPSGTVYIGPAHPRCNRSEGARRGNRARGSHQPAPRRWTL